MTAPRLLTASAVLLVLLAVATPVLAVPITVFEDDGSGFDPVTTLPNPWNADDGSVWSVGTTVMDVANLPTWSGSSAAADMVAQLGATNDVIVANQLASGDNTLFLLPSISGTTPGGQNFVLDFAHQAINSLLLNTTHIWDSVEILADDGAGGGIDIIVRTEMAYLTEATDPSVIQATLTHLEETQPGDTDVIDIEIVALSLSDPEFIDMGLVEFQGNFDFAPGECIPGPCLIGVVSISEALHVVPEPGTALLLGLGLTALASRRKHPLERR